MKKKCIKKRKAPSYAFGLDQVNQLSELIGSVGGAMANGADDTSKAMVAGSTFSGMGKGASLGSKIGSIGGPLGKGIGAAVGAVGGALGGLFTGRKKRQEALARERRQAQTNETMLALGNQAEMEQEYWDDNNLAYTFENGGILPDLAWVDNNEIIRDDAGNLIKVPNTKAGTDNHLINATHLDSVLSDKLKRPGTNKTFAQEGEKLTKMTKGSKGKDRFAKASDELNKIHANQMYNTLLSEQAEVKAKKGIKSKVKGVAPAYEIGKNGVRFDRRYNAKFDSSGNYLGKIDSTAYSPYEMNIQTFPINDTLTIDKKNNITDILNTRLSTANTSLGTAKKYTPSPDVMADIASDYVSMFSQVMPDVEITNQPHFDNLEVVGTDLRKQRQEERQKYAQDLANHYMNMFSGNIPGEYLTALQYAANSAPVDGITGETILADNAKSNNAAATVETPVTKTSVASGNKVKTGKTKRASVKTPVTAPREEIKLEPLTPRKQLLDVQAPASILESLTPPSKIKLKTTQPQQTNKFNIADFDLSAISDMAPLMAGMFAKPEYESQVYNPYTGAINRAMARRKANIEPTLAANRRSRAISNRNLANISSNTGANLAARTQSAVGEYAQNADLYANRDNANNQYLAEYANMMNNLGQQFAQNAVYTNDLNARNRAAVRNARNRSIENYSKWHQNKQLMKNQMARDEALYPLLKDFLSYGTKNEYLTKLDKRYGNK